METKPRMFLEPLLNIIVVVSSIIVQDQMQLHFRGRLAVDLTEKS